MAMEHRGHRGRSMRGARRVYKGICDPDGAVSEKRLRRILKNSNLVQHQGFEHHDWHASWAWTFFNSFDYSATGSKAAHVYRFTHRPRARSSKVLTSPNGQHSSKTNILMGKGGKGLSRSRFSRAKLYGRRIEDTFIIAPSGESITAQSIKHTLTPYFSS